MPRTETTSPQNATNESAKPLRKDAERNRQLVLEAAARLFARRGVDVGFEEIAHEAGVGVGTVYRRFPDRHALISALIADRYEPILTKWERSLEQEWNPRELLEEFCRQLVDEASSDTGLRETLFEMANEEASDDLHQRISSLFDRVVTQAHDAQVLRPEVTAEDIAVVTIALSHLRGASGALTPRYVAMMLQGAYLADVERFPLPGQAPTDAETLAIVKGA